MVIRLHEKISQCRSPALQLPAMVLEAGMHICTGKLAKLANGQIGSAVCILGSDVRPLFARSARFQGQPQRPRLKDKKQLRRSCRVLKAGSEWKVQCEATKIKTANAALVPVYHLRLQGSGIEEIRVSRCVEDRGFWHALAHDPMHRNGGRDRSRKHPRISKGTCLSMFAVSR